MWLSCKQLAGWLAGVLAGMMRARCAGLSGCVGKSSNPVANWLAFDHSGEPGGWRSSAPEARAGASDCAAFQPPILPSGKPAKPADGALAPLLSRGWGGAWRDVAYP